MAEQAAREAVLALEPEGTDRTYKLRGVMSFRGAPVDWNARACIWHGSDRREPVRHMLRKLGWRCKYGGRLRRFLLDTTDDRDREYSSRCRTARRWLGTDADVEARKAWMVACKYWRNRA